MPRRPNPPKTGDPVIDTGAVLTPRERKLVEGVTKGLTQVEAAMQAGYSRGTAVSSASEILSQPVVQAHWRACLAQAGLTVMDRAELLADAARNATSMVVDKNGEEHFHRDYRSAIEAIRVAGQLDGSIGPRQAEGAAGNTINIYVDQRAAPQEVIDITPDSL